MGTWTAFSASSLVLPKADTTAETTALNRSYPFRQRKGYHLLGGLIIIINITIIIIIFIIAVFDIIIMLFLSL